MRHARFHVNLNATTQTAHALTQRQAAKKAAPLAANKRAAERLLVPLRLWHDRIEAWMVAQAGVEFEANSTKAEPEVAAELQLVYTAMPIRRGRIERHRRLGQCFTTPTAQRTSNLGEWGRLSPLFS